MTIKKICPFIQKECIKKECLAWDKQCLVINKTKTPRVKKSDHSTELIDINHKELVNKLQKLAINKKSNLKSTTLEDIYLKSIGFHDTLTKESQDKLDKAINEAMSDLLDQICPGYFITDGVEEIAKQMFDWIVKNLEVVDIWDCQQKFLKEHNINEFKLSFNSEIFKIYKEAIRILRNKLTVYKDKLKYDAMHADDFKGIYIDSETGRTYKEIDGKKVLLGKE